MNKLPVHAVHSYFIARYISKGKFIKINQIIEYQIVLFAFES